LPVAAIQLLMPVVAPMPLRKAAKPLNFDGKPEFSP